MKDFNSLVTEHFKVLAEQIVDTMSSKDIPEWDSMNYLLFIADIEKEYTVSLTMDEVLNVQTVGDIKNILRTKGIAV